MLGDTIMLSTAPIKSPVDADFLVVAGGGSGSTYYYQFRAGAGGAGGLRTSYGSTSGGGASAENKITLNPGITYTITVGAGGSGTGTKVYYSTMGSTSSISGSDITDITTVGGGGGGYYSAIFNYNGSTGGSGGGGGYRTQAGAITQGYGGSGTANQGYDGGNGNTYSAGGGGGAGEAAHTVDSDYPEREPGDGLNILIASRANAVTSSIGDTFGNVPSSAVYYAGGGHPVSGAGQAASPRSLGGGGVGLLNGTSYDSVIGAVGRVNSGGGGGGGYNYTAAYSHAGGSGIVIIRMPAAQYSGEVTGSPDVYDEGTDKVIIFKGSGTYTH